MANKNAAAPKADKPSTAEKPASGNSIKTMRVKATRKGYYGEMLRPPGMVFNITVRPGEKMPSWVEPFDDETPASEPAAAQPVETASSQSPDDVI